MYKIINMLRHEHIATGRTAKNCKLIGVYASVNECQIAILRLIQLPGFRDHPDGFRIDEYIVDQDRITEGFEYS
jgi:hypothetical protein